MPALDQTISIHLDREVAVTLLRHYGFTQDERGRWLSANGVGYWCIDEALTICLRVDAERIAEGVA